MSHPGRGQNGRGSQIRVYHVVEIVYISSAIQNRSICLPDWWKVEPMVAEEASKMEPGAMETGHGILARSTALNIGSFDWQTV